MARGRLIGAPLLAGGNLDGAHPRWIGVGDDSKPSSRTAFGLYPIKDGKLAEHRDAN